MRLNQAILLISLLLSFVPAPIGSDHQLNRAPRIDMVEPAAAKPGALITAYGVNLSRSRVADLVLSHNDVTALARVMEQRDNMIRFRIPNSLATGRYRIVLVVSGPVGSELVDQETYIDVLEEEASAMKERAGWNDALRAI